ncbi:MAG TPA: alanine racemase [Gemmatimonadaceae bacterium]|nr:alanine racemase [Gemmatimonadaceae bacterium]
MLNRRGFLATAAAAGLPHVAGVPRPKLAEAPISIFDPWLEIDASALAYNASAVARLGGGSNARPIIAVAKNNAYGLGLEVAGPLLDRLPEVRMLAVVRPSEALALRNAGVKKPVLLMGPASEDELLELVPLDVVQSPYRAAAPAILGKVAERLQRPVRIHLYVDTGMHRMGIPVGQALPWVEALAKSGAVRIEGAFTELVEDPEFDRQQAARLRALKADAAARGIDIGTLHAASSDAVMHGTSETFLDAVRPGLALYGGYVSERALQRGELRPSYRLKARVLRVDRLEAGEGVSYHRRWTTDKPIWTATLGVGHVDGYPSGAVKGCEVLIRGKLFPVVGTVSASHTVVALGAEESAQVGDEATLVGPDRPALHPNEVARRAGWSEYNMFMHLGASLRRGVINAQ